MSFSDNISTEAFNKVTEGSAIEAFITCEEGTHETTTYETLREQFVRPQEQTSIFDDNVEDILEMNATIAMLTKTILPDPLAQHDELVPDEEENQLVNQEDLDQNTTAVLSKLNEEKLNILYDSDGNPMEMYESDEASYDADEPQQPANNEAELPIRLGYLNMNRYLLDNGLTKNVLSNIKPNTDVKIEDSGKSSRINKKLKVDRVVDKLTHSISQGLSYKDIQELDSEDDILEVVAINEVKKLPPRVAKQKELFRLAQEQARKRRQDDQDYLQYRIAEQKRKKQLKKEAKLAKERAQQCTIQKEGSTLDVKNNNQKESLAAGESGVDNVQMSEADLANLLEGEDYRHYEPSEKAYKESHEASEEEISTKELPSSQGAFRHLADEDVSTEGIIDELNLQSEELSSEAETISDDEVSVGQRKSNANAGLLDSEEENSSETVMNRSDDAVYSGFNPSSEIHKGGDVLNLLSGNFAFHDDAGSQEASKLIPKDEEGEIGNALDVMDLLSGEFVIPEAQCDTNEGTIGFVAQEVEIPSLNPDITHSSRSKRTTVTTPSDEVPEELHESEKEDTKDTVSEADYDFEAAETDVRQPNLRTINEVLREKKEPVKISAPSFKSAFVEEEADVEEDEFMNFGGADGEIDARLDRYDPEFVGEADKEVVENYDDIIELHRKQMQQKHENDVSKLLHDVTTGNLRKRALRSGSNGKGLDTDSDEENDLLLRKIRKRAAPAFMLDDIDDADMTNLQKLAADPRSLAFAKCFVRDENDIEGCISSDEETKNEPVGPLKDIGLNSINEKFSSDSEDSDLDIKNPNSNAAIPLQPHSIKSPRECENVLLEDQEVYRTTLSSERLGLDIFGIVKERRQRMQNAKKSKVQTSELHKYAYKRTIESTRISQKQSFAVFAQNLALKENRSTMSKEVDIKVKKKSFQAFQIGSSGTNIRKDESKKLEAKQPMQQINKKNQNSKEQPNLQILSLLTRKI